MRQDIGEYKAWENEKNEKRILWKEPVGLSKSGSDSYFLATLEWWFNKDFNRFTKKQGGGVLVLLDIFLFTFKHHDSWFAISFFALEI